MLSFQYQIDRIYVSKFSCLGHQKIVSFLLSSGANVEAVAKNNWTPLLVAAHNGILQTLNQFPISPQFPNRFWPTIEWKLN